MDREARAKGQLVTQSYIPRAMMRRVDGERSILGGDRARGSQNRPLLRKGEDE